MERFIEVNLYDQIKLHVKYPILNHSTPDTLQTDVLLVYIPV
jgi:hypothetical protein